MFAQTDRAIFARLNQSRYTHPDLDRWVRAFSSLGSFSKLWFGTGIVLALSEWGEYRHMALIDLCGVVSAVVGVLTEFIKLFFRRKRPALTLANVRLVGNAPKTTSFPSGHSSSSAAAVGYLCALGFIAWPFFLALVPLAISMGLTRIYLGVHYPSDVVAGWALGIVLGILLAHFVLAL